MDFLRNYTADQEESEDLDSNREQTASPTGSSSSSSAGSPRRKTSAKRREDQKDDCHGSKDNSTGRASDKEDKGRKSRKEPNEGSSSTSSDDDRSSRASSSSDSTGDSDSKSRSRSPAAPSSGSRATGAKNGAKELKTSTKSSSGGGSNSNRSRNSQSPVGQQKLSSSGSSSNKTTGKSTQDRMKSPPPKQNLQRRDRSNSRERDRKNREKERERERDRNRDRNRERERERDRDMDRDKDRQRDRDRNRDRERDRGRDRDRSRNERERDRDRDRDRGSIRNSRDYRDQRRGGNWSKSNDRDHNRRDSRGYDRKDDRKDTRGSSDYDKDRRRSRRSNSRESRNRRRHSPNDRISSRARDSRSRSRSRSRSHSKSSPPHVSQQQTPSLPPCTGGLLPTPVRFSHNLPAQSKPTSLLPTPPASQSLLGAIPIATSAGIPSLMSIPTKPPISSLIPAAVAAKLNLSNEAKLAQLGLPMPATPQDPIVANNLLSRSALLRNTAKAAQLEKMGIDVLQQNQKAVDSVPLPSYYNPGVVNPVRYADQVQKRKLLWSHKSTESKEVSSNISKWEQAKFAQDTDGRMASKFLRLMGVKDSLSKPGDESGPSHPVEASSTIVPASTVAGSGLKGSATASSNGGKPSGDSIKKQEELFSTMEQQYEVARQVTHTMRGVGLGFSSQARQF